MGALDRQAILAAQDSKRREVVVPEWGGSVFVRALNGLEHKRYQQIITGRREMVQTVGSAEPSQMHFEIDVSSAVLYVASVCIVDGNGMQLFGEGDMDELGGKNGEVLGRLAEIALSLSGLADAEEEDALADPLPASKTTSRRTRKPTPSSTS